MNIQELGQHQCRGHGGLATAETSCPKCKTHAHAWLWTSCGKALSAWCCTKCWLFVQFRKDSVTSLADIAAVIASEAARMKKEKFDA